MLIDRLAGIAAIALSLAACASTPGVAPLGEGRYTVSRQAATGFSGKGSLRVDTLREADDFCRSRQQEMSVEKIDENEGPFIFGRYPFVNVEFRCQTPR